MTESDVDDLFALPPGEFVAARDALVRRLRSSGEREAAKEVKQLRRPTVAAWALNQLVRRHGDDVRDLVDQGRALAEAQQQAVAGGAAGLRETSRARREVLRRLADAAEGLLAERGGGAHREEVVGTLTAASSDPGAGEELLGGRLSEPIPAPAGFGLSAMGGAPSEEGAGKPPRQRVDPTEEPGVEHEAEDKADAAAGVEAPEAETRVGPEPDTGPEGEDEDEADVTEAEAEPDAEAAPTAGDEPDTEDEPDGGPDLERAPTDIDPASVADQARAGREAAERAALAATDLARDAKEARRRVRRLEEDLDAARRDAEAATRRADEAEDEAERARDAADGAGD